ncbi:hypothetical protein [Massilia niabensis]|uniref:Uncharacterized protein n=1 Tax=Massilia niabensis TaxID=544910 RepID=A0ABW0LA84_9BURK
MNVELSTTIVVTAGGDEVGSHEVQEGKHHCLRAQSDSSNGDIVLDFSTRRAMYNFAVSLLQEAVHGTSGQQEFYPLGHEGQWRVVNGVRMSEGSSRLFVFYGIDTPGVGPS